MIQAQKANTVLDENGTTHLTTYDVGVVTWLGCWLDGWLGCWDVYWLGCWLAKPIHEHPESCPRLLLSGCWPNPKYIDFPASQWPPLRSKEIDILTKVIEFASFSMDSTEKQGN